MFCILYSVDCTYLLSSGLIEQKKTRVDFLLLESMHLIADQSIQEYLGFTMIGPNSENWHEYDG